MRTSLFSPACALWMVFALSGCSSLPESKTVRANSVRFSYISVNVGGPVAVFQSGLGDGMSVWSGVIGQHSSTYSVFAYDRPGYGSSSPVGEARAPCSVAKELREVLRAAGVQPPYVLVGHSIGGLYQYAYAKLFPDDVAAILLLDPTHPNHWVRMTQEDSVATYIVLGLRNTIFSQVMRREFDDQAKCLDDLRSLKSPSVPMRLLARSKFEALESEGFKRVVRSLEAEWAKLLPGISRSEVQGAGHYIQKDRPDVVERELQQLSAQTRQGKQ